MRTLLIGAGICLTAGTFVVAERLTSSKEQETALQQQAATAAALQDFKTTSGAELAALRDENANAKAQMATLLGSLDEMTTARDDLARQVTTAEEEATEIRASLAELQTANAALLEEVKAKDASLGATTAELEALTAQIETLGQNGPDSSEAAGTEELLAEIAGLTEALAAREETISSLQAQIDASVTAAADTAPADGTGANEALLEELELAKATIEDLTGAAAASEAELAALNETLRDREAAVARLQSELDDQMISAATVSLESAGVEPDEGQALSAQIAVLSELVASQKETISHLRMGFDAKPESMEMASACIERANKIFEISQIKFATGTSAISEQSTTTLDHLRDLAIGCESEDMFIEIGGHTDSLGAEDANQRLSEARANSVRDFMISRGIPAETMIAVGFGETQPIATNDTLEGRAQNRRITFTWQMRDDTPEEVTTENVDG